MAYNKDIIKKVLLEFENKNKNAHAKAELKKKELHREIPELKKIDTELSDTGLKIVREILKHSGSENIKETIDNLKLYNNELLERRKVIFAEYNIDESICEPAFECDKCKDTGYTKNNKACKCLKKALALESLISSGLGHIIKDQTFETFKYTFYKTDDIRKKMENVVKICHIFAEEFVIYAEENKNGKTGNFIPKYKNLLFFGNTGLGKTHLSSSIANVVISNGYEVVYSSAQNIISDFEKDRFTSASSYSKEMDSQNNTDKYFTCDLLIIDDLGVEQNGSMTVPTVYNILNTRLKDKKSMIINTNLSYTLLQKKYDERIVSRLLGEFTALVFSGEDIRLQKIDRRLPK